jgi:pheromone alpha factor receptor
MVVAIFLPLSSMWASFNTSNNASAANMRQADVYRPNMIIGQDTTRNTSRSANGNTSNGTSGTFASERPLNASFNTQGTLVNSPSMEAINNPQKLGAKGFAGVNTAERDSLELEMRQHGIAQGRSYSVRSD